MNRRRPKRIELFTSRKFGSKIERETTELLNMDAKDAKSVGSDNKEHETPETRYFKMMMQDNEIGRVELGADNADADSIIGGQTIASLMQDGKIATAARESNTAESYSESNEQSTMSIVGYDDVSTIANDTVNETTKAFFTGNGSREDSKPRIRLFKEYSNDYKTPEKKKKSGDEVDDDEQTQPETPPGMIKVRSSQKSNSSYDEEALNTGAKMKNRFLRSRQRVYLVAGVLALVLFIAIIALAVALKGVRGTGSSGSSPSVVESSAEDNGLLDIWPDLDSVVKNEEPSGKSEDPTVQPVNTTPEPTLSPTVRAPTLEPTVDETAEIMFGVAVNLLVERGIATEKELEKRKDSSQYKSTIWLSQDPNYYDYTEERLIQRWTLAVLAQSLDPTIEAPNSLRSRRLQNGSDLLPGWMTYTDECSWFSRRSTEWPCDEDGMYRILDLKGLMLGGTLPTELGLLSNSLEHMLLDGNGLTGTVPEELENLTNLVSLRLRRNNLEEELSIDFAKLTSLEILDVGENKLTGSVLYDLLDLNAPTEIYLDNNDLDGDIPWNIGDLNTLSTLALSGNSLTGWVPDSLEDIDDLKVLTLGNNNLKGNLPKGVCKLKELETLSVDCAVQGCDCCTECANTSSPTANPTVAPTISPTFSPTKSPTVSPTKSPTNSPTASPTGTPTTSPTTSPTGSPTPSPTGSPSAAPIVQVPSSSPSECIAEISVADFCFAPQTNIEISFSNCYAQKDDWVGIYRVDQTFDRNNLPTDSVLWSWACGTRNCRVAANQQTFPLNAIHGDNGRWPLQPGLYAAILARNTAAPYVAYAVSDTFVVAAQC